MQSRLAFHRYYCGVFHAERGLSPGRRFETLGEAQAFLDSLTGRPTWKRLRRPYARVTAERPQGTRSRADFEHGLLLLHSDHDYEQAILHQLAHLGSGPEALHGAPFRRVYLRLTAAVRGPEAADVLASGFEDERLPLWARHDPSRAAQGLEWASSFAETLRPPRRPALTDYCARRLDVFALGEPRRP